MIDSILTNTVLPKVSEEILTRMIAGNPITKVAIGVKDDEFSYEFD
jgi:type VI secretion system protein VasG